METRRIRKNRLSRESYHLLKLDPVWIANRRRQWRDNARRNKAKLKRRRAARMRQNPELIQRHKEAIRKWRASPKGKAWIAAYDRSAEKAPLKRLIIRSGRPCSRPGGLKPGLRPKRRQSSKACARRRRPDSRAARRR